MLNNKLFDGVFKMTIKRIEMSPRMSQAVVHGGLVYVAGQVSPPEAKETTVAGQTRLILARIDQPLAEAGTSKDCCTRQRLRSAISTTRSRMA